MGVRILVAESDPALARIIERGLRAHGFEVASVEGGAQALELTSDASVRLLLFDLTDSNEILDAVRGSRPELPILRLVGGDPPPMEGGPGSLVQHADGSEQGLPHSLRKPFALEELIARIRALTRRPNERRITTLTAGDVRIDLLARCAWRGAQVIDLPDREFALLEYFMRHPNRVLSRSAILSDVWGYHFDATSNVVDVYVRYLRNKLDRPGERSLIASVRGVGYRFDPP